MAGGDEVDSQTDVSISGTGKTDVNLQWDNSSVADGLYLGTIEVKNAVGDVFADKEVVLSVNGNDLSPPSSVSAADGDHFWPVTFPNGNVQDPPHAIPDVFNGLDGEVNGQDSPPSYVNTRTHEGTGDTVGIRGTHVQFTARDGGGKPAYIEWPLGDKSEFSSIPVDGVGAVGGWFKIDSFGGRSAVPLFTIDSLDDVTNTSWGIAVEQTGNLLVAGNTQNGNTICDVAGGGAELELGTWHSFVVSVDDNTADTSRQVELFLDGSVVASGELQNTDSSLNLSDHDTIRFGAAADESDGPTASYIEAGGIDNLWYSDTPVDAGEVSDWYDRTKSLYLGPNDVEGTGGLGASNIDHKWTHQDISGDTLPDSGTATALDGTLSSGGARDTDITQRPTVRTLSSGHEYISYNRRLQQYTTLPSDATALFTDLYSSGRGTISFWMRPDRQTNESGNGLSVFGSRANPQTDAVNSFTLRASGANAFRSSVDTTSDYLLRLLAGSALDSEGWNNVTITASQDSATVYVDGVEVGTTTPKDSAFNTNELAERPLFGATRESDGSVADSLQFQGGISQVRIDSEAVSQQTVQQWYEETKGNYPDVLYERLSDLPTGGRKEHFMGADNGSVYIAMGETPDFTDSAYKYDIASDSWTQIATAPTTIEGSASAFVDVNFKKKFVVAGGQGGGASGEKQAHIYDPADDSWSSSSDTLSFAPQNGAGGAYDGKLYGWVGETSTTGAIFSYDPAADSFTELQTGLSDRPGNGPAGVYDDGSGPVLYIYTKGDLLTYDIDADTVGTISGPSVFQTATVGDVSQSRGKLLAVGGFDAVDGSSRTKIWHRTYSYDFSSGKWSRLSDVPGRHADGNGVIYDDVLYVAGGRNSFEAGSAGSLYEKMHELDLSDEFGTVTDPTVPSSLTNRWKIDEGSGTSLSDSIGSDTGTVNGATWVSDSTATGGAKLDHDGTDDYIEAPTDINATDYSVVGWFQFDQRNSSNDIVSGTNTSNEGFRLTHDTSGDDLRLAHIGASFNPVTTVGDITTGDWYMVAITGSGDSADLHLYDTSGLVDQTSGSGNRTVTSSSLRVMSHGTLQKFGNGDVDDVAVAVGTTLSDSEVQDYWDATVGTR